MKKTITNRVIKTTNGVTTTSKAIYVKKLKTYTPLANGFNLELAKDIIAMVEASQGKLWDQHAWRAVIPSSAFSGDEDLQSIVKTFNPGLVTDEARCGTKMCIAGWAAELTGVDWVKDAAALKEDVPGHIYWGETVLVRREEGDLEDGSILWADPNLVTELNARGFSKETHNTGYISTIAAEALGIGGDPLALFSATNSWSQVLAIIDAYSECGPEADESDPRVEALVHGKRGIGTRPHRELLDEYTARGMGIDYHQAHPAAWA